MLLLNKEQMKKLISMENAIDIVEKALLSYGKGETIAPLRAHIPVGENSTSLFMPAYIPNMNSLGIKIVSVFPENISKEKEVVIGKMILLDDKTGEIIAMMDGTFLTQIRTGAVGALGIKYMSKKNSKILALIGAGGQSEEQIHGALLSRDIEEVRIFNRGLTQSEKLGEKLSKIYNNVRFIASKTVEECIDNADIVITATISKTPVFNFKDLREGAHINGIGSYTKEMEEIPKEVLSVAKYIAVDTEAAIKESGDLQGVTNAIEISKIIADNSLINRKDKDITFYKSTGSSIFDVSVAKFIYDQGIKRKIGTIIDF